MAAFALAWAAFVVWSVATFTALEAFWPRHAGAMEPCAAPPMSYLIEVHGGDPPA